MEPRKCSILLLKEPPTPPELAPFQQTPSGTLSNAVDPYSDALHSAFSQHHGGVHLNVEYLPPMTTLYPKTTLLSRAIAAGYPPGHAHSENHAEFGMLWAFAVTSQNAVSAVEAALRNQPDTGATLACVQRAGFKNINPQDSSSSPEPNTTLPTPSPFENAAQLVDFLIALKWPTTCAVQADDSTRRQTISVSANDTEEITDQASFFPPSVPELWFLTGETRMKTLAEKLSAHQRAFREVTFGHEV
ncbi:hypothetical protein BGX29_004047 [Mortierella sp. GBA35]|nr:hypothetical protein BGX29_004047 [Mortierella sp. GBA35]